MIKPELYSFFDKNDNISSKKLKTIYNSELYLKVKEYAGWNDQSSILEKLYCFNYDIEVQPLCKNCKKNPVSFVNFKKGYSDFCNNRCSSSSEETKEKIKKTCLEKYGVEYALQANSVKEKIKNTSLEKYGVEHYTRTNEWKENVKKTSLEKYGVEHYSKTNEWKENVKNTSLNLFGEINYSKTNECKEKIKKTCLERYNINHHSKINSKEMFSLLEDKEWLEEQYNLYPAWKIAELYGTSQSTISLYIRKHEIKNNKWNRNKSFIENDIFDFISKLNFKINKNCRNIIPPKEIDAYITEKNLAIEIDGIYWHSEKYKNKDYHLNKTLECEKQGIQLLHIFENEWNDQIKQEIWKSVIKSKLNLNEKIYARKCIVKEVSNVEGRIFFEENHLQGGLKRGKHIGLYYNNELVCCISYGKSRFEKNVFEIYRFANKLYNNVIGGFSKLLKHLPRPIISYANRRWSNGNLYEKNGFKLESISPPNYFYVVDGELHSRQRYQKHKLKEMKSYDENLTEEQIMELEGYRRIYDCGNLKYVKI